MADWLTANVERIEHWTERLFSLRITADIAPFMAGQFTKLALIQPDGELLQRAYSFVNAPKQKQLEFYIANLTQGKLSQQLHQLKPGDPLLITHQSSGFFTLSEVPDCHTLWLFATGAALGPYLSILQQNEGLARFQRIVLVHAARYIKELNYAALISDLVEQFRGKLIYQAITSQQSTVNILTGRIPELIANKSLEKSVGLTINAQDSHVMLCGNPMMIAETRRLLCETRAMRKHLRRQAGQISSEQYW